MPKPDNNLDFSHKDERSHTIEKPHPPIPVSLQDWLASILRRLLATKAPTSSEEHEEDKKEE